MSKVFGGDTASGSPALLWQLPVFGEHVQADSLRRPPTADELDAIDAAAREEGFARGYAEGLAAGAVEARAQAQRLAEVLQHCALPLQQLDAGLEATLVDLAMAAARRLTQQQFALDPQKMAATVNEAVAALATLPRELRVHLHAADAALLKEHLSMPMEVVGWRIVVDPALARGDCRIAADGGWVDATLATRERVLAQSLLGDRELDV